MRRSGLGAVAETTLALGVDGLAAGTAAEVGVVDFDAHAPAAIHTPATSDETRTAQCMCISSPSRGFTSVTRYRKRAIREHASHPFDLGALVGVDIRCKPEYVLVLRRALR